MTNVEVLELALGTSMAKDVIEIKITFACDCQADLRKKDKKCFVCIFRVDKTYNKINYVQSLKSRRHSCRIEEALKQAADL